MKNKTSVTSLPGIAFAAAAAVTMAGLCAPVAQAAPGCRDKACVDNCVNGAYATNDAAAGAAAAQRCMTDFKPQEEYCAYSKWDPTNHCRPCNDPTLGRDEPCDPNFEIEPDKSVQPRKYAPLPPGALNAN
jgi:hypothetical protein